MNASTSSSTILRVKAEHDRITWTLRPVNMAHRVLARRGAVAAAEAWRARLREETNETAATLVEEARPSSKGTGACGWRASPTASAGRSRAMLEQDELEALVEPAVAELGGGEPAGAGAALEAKAESFLGVASGSGVEVPEWLERLSAVVDRALERADALPLGGAARVPTGLPDCVPWAVVSWDALRESLGE